MYKKCKKNLLYCEENRVLRDFVPASDACILNVHEFEGNLYNIRVQFFSTIEPHIFYAR